VRLIAARASSPIDILVAGAGRSLGAIFTRKAGGIMRSSIVAAAVISMVMASPASAAAPTNVTPPSITVVGETLVADFGTWAGTEPISVQGEWLVCLCGFFDDDYNQSFGSASAPLPFSALGPIRGPVGAPGRVKEDFFGEPPIPGLLFWSVGLFVTASNSEGQESAAAFVNLKDSCFTTNRPENCITKRQVFP
jgi:hypothetical protein